MWKTLPLEIQQHIYEYDISWRMEFNKSISFFRDISPVTHSMTNYLLILQKLANFYLKKGIDISLMDRTHETIAYIPVLFMTSYQKLSNIEQEKIHKFIDMNFRNDFFQQYFRWANVSKQ